MSVRISPINAEPKRRVSPMKTWTRLFDSRKRSCLRREGRSRPLGDAVMQNWSERSVPLEQGSWRMLSAERVIFSSPSLRRLFFFSFITSLTKSIFVGSAPSRELICLVDGVCHNPFFLYFSIPRLVPSFSFSLSLTGKAAGSVLS